MLDLVARVRRDDEIEPVPARLVCRLRDDFDDIAVLEARPQRHHLAVDPGADALMSDIGMNGVGKVDRRRPARKRLDEPLRREGVHLFGVELDFEVLDELLRVAHLLLVLQQLTHPLEVPIVTLIADASFLVFPMRRDALFRPAMHFYRADLHLERHAVLADHRRMERLVAVRPRHRDEILDSTREG